MLKSSGSSYQFEARLGGISACKHNPRLILADDYNRPLMRYLPHTRHAQSTIDAVLRQPTTLVSTRCGALVSVRCVSSLQATQLVYRPSNRRPGWDGPSFRACERRDPTQWAQAAKTRRVRTTGTQTGMLPGISR